MILCNVPLRWSKLTILINLDVSEYICLAGFPYFWQVSYISGRFPSTLAGYPYTQSVLIRNGLIRSTSEILAFFKKSQVEL